MYPDPRWAMHKHVDLRRDVPWFINSEAYWANNPSDVYEQPRSDRGRHDRAQPRPSLNFRERWASLWRIPLRAGNVAHLHLWWHRGWRKHPGDDALLSRPPDERHWNER